MRKPTPSERRLMLIFGLIIVGALHIVIFRWAMGAKDALSSEVFRLQSAVDEYRLLLAEKDFWEARKQWLAAHPFDEHHGRQSESQFAEDIQASLQRHGLTISSQQMKESSQAGGLVEAQFEFSARGSLEKIIRWLGTTQQPGHHIAVRAFTLKRLEDGDLMEARMRIGKIFRTAGATP
jgi:hypothetical protein